jgi:hypothetical protein
MRASVRGSRGKALYFFVILSEARNLSFFSQLQVEERFLGRRCDLGMTKC